VKKVLIFLLCVSLLLVFSTSGDEKIIIPTSAIRYRIIANSNNIEDQGEKLLIQTQIDPVIEEILNNSESIEDSRKNIIKSIPKIENIVGRYNDDFEVNYGLNYFPEKNYKGVSYNAGNYESLVITLGEGLGENWWCVLFPPLCLLEAKEDSLDEMTYSFYIKDVINRFY